jgi:hypothetical protein
MKTGIRTLGPAIFVVVIVAAVLSGCVDNGLVAPSDSSIRVSANPATVVIDPNTQTPDPDTGRFTGTTAIDAIVLDASGFPMQGISVVFRTTAGTLASGGAANETDANGVVSDTLTVTDLAPSSVTVQALSGNLEGETTVTVAIVGDNILPNASFSVDPTSPGQVGELITFDGRASTDPDGGITCYQWTLTSDNPDGVNPEVIQGQTAAVVTKTFTNEQNLSVTLKVSDQTDAGNICDPADPPVPGNLFSPLIDSRTYNITCANNPPVARIVSDNGLVEVTLPAGSSPTDTASVLLDGRQSFDPEGTFLLYTWACPGAQSGPFDQSGPNDDPNSLVQCNYTPGTHPNVSLYVTDLGWPTPGECVRQSTTEFVTVIVTIAGTP